VNIKLKDTNLSDLDVLFDFQTDAEANYLAAFTAVNPEDKTAYLEKWKNIISDKEKINKTIFLDDEIVGSVSKFEFEGKPEITYWIGKNFWGKGIATRALQMFLEIEKTRPIFARTAFDNFGSGRVLEKCGFEKIGKDKGFANARGKEIEEFIYELK
jgi:RimJ/RimL family protein N-acetyltransferase